MGPGFIRLLLWDGLKVEFDGLRFPHGVVTNGCTYFLCRRFNFWNSVLWLFSYPIYWVYYII